jgi:hypothetical protein
MFLENRMYIAVKNKLLFDVPDDDGAACRQAKAWPTQHAVLLLQGGRRRARDTKKEAQGPC